MPTRPLSPALVCVVEHWKGKEVMITEWQYVDPTGGFEFREVVSFGTGLSVKAIVETTEYRTRVHNPNELVGIAAHDYWLPEIPEIKVNDQKEKPTPEQITNMMKEKYPGQL